uniref:RING-type domain-containing protein n=1 Tax=viral metagenome TaxID=1070528 RepID=A0A6C0JJA5_9ZZZZ
MEECIICFEETKDFDFVMFKCNHKVCTKCFPLLIETTSRCPNCDIVLNIEPKVQIYEYNLYNCRNRCMLFVVIFVIFIIIYNNNING